MTSKVRCVSRALLAVVLAWGVPSLDAYRTQTKVLDNKQGKAETGPDPS